MPLPMTLTVFCRWRGKWLARVYRRAGDGADLVLVLAGSWSYVRRELREELGR